ncbi:hypothetical protein [Bacillus sp. JCM 19034]|uniref:hypothetical protein n=1 Tax=Bacillus sp. JCM 19034 TaxID=1481928 RepID=UPI000783876D|nr:hypothetical protein [Bacillus sp. JCM 19034]
MQLINLDGKFLRPNLDLLFVALNPPVNSNNNGHYFSGKQSSFFKQLYLSGLINSDIDKSKADELIFSKDSMYNYKGKEFGVVDLLPNLVETDSSKVRVRREDVILLLNRIKVNNPKVVCIIHSKVKKEVEKVINKRLDYGKCGDVIADCNTVFYCNYFPNGNNIPTQKKLSIYESIKKN